MADQAAQGYAIDALKPGMSATYERTVTVADIEAFAAVSGDHNPVHLDDAYAKTTMFKGRVAHGMLGASFISDRDRLETAGPGLDLSRPVAVVQSAGAAWRQGRDRDHRGRGRRRQEAASC